MPKLTITTNQEGVITDVEGDLEAAFANGVQDTDFASVVDAMKLYSHPSVQSVKTDVKAAFKSLLAAMMVAFNIKRAFPVGLTTTVTLAKLTALGTEGSLTFTDGILTGKIDPT